MTRILGELLGARQPDFSSLIQRLEQAAGHPRADIRLTQDVAHKSREALGKLHLDTHSSTNQEFYAALLNKVAVDERKILEGLSVHNTADTELLLWSIQRFVQRQVAGHKVLVVKQVVVKRLLKQLQPKKTMRALGYRSLDSMLKHESAASLLLAVRLAESGAWLKKLHKQYQSLQASDFEERDIQIFQPRTARWKRMGEAASLQKRHNVLALSEVGVVSLLPISSYLQGLALVDLVVTLTKCNDMFAISSYIKLQRMTPAFGQEVARIAEASDISDIWLGDHEVTWQTLHTYLAGQEALGYFDPHLHQEDLFTLPVEKVLEELYPNMSFWDGIGHVLRQDVSGVLSCNVLDAAINYCNQLDYTKASIYHAQQKLWQHMTSKYLSSDVIERQLLPVLQPVPQEADLPEYSS